MRGTAMKISEQTVCGGKAGEVCSPWSLRLARLRGAEVLGDKSGRVSIVGRSMVAKQDPGRTGSAAH